MKRLLLLSIFFLFNLSMFGQETKTIHQTYHFTIVKTYQEKINDYQTGYCTVYNVKEKGIQNYVLKVVITNNLNRIALIQIGAEGVQYGLFYSSMSDVADEVDENNNVLHHTYTNDIEDQDDGSILSCNQQINKCITIIKQKDGYFIIRKIASTLNMQGDVQISEYVSANQIKNAKK
jgi:hypothetical protein